MTTQGTNWKNKQHSKMQEGLLHSLIIISNSKKCGSHGCFCHLDFLESWIEDTKKNLKCNTIALNCWVHKYLGVGWKSLSFLEHMSQILYYYSSTHYFSSIPIKYFLKMSNTTVSVNLVTSCIVTFFEWYCSVIEQFLFKFPHLLHLHLWNLFCRKFSPLSCHLWLCPGSPHWLRFSSQSLTLVMSSYFSTLFSYSF